MNTAQPDQLQRSKQFDIALQSAPLINQSELPRIALIKGEIIIADIIGKGFYEIVNFGETFVMLKCLKLFGKGFYCRGHITNCHNYPKPIDLKKWLSYRRVTMKLQSK